MFLLGAQTLYLVAGVYDDFLFQIVGALLIYVLLAIITVDFANKICQHLI